MRKARKWKTDLCSRLGIEVPIIGAPMGGVAGPELAAAVSAAGGLGLLGHALVDLDEMPRQIGAVRAATDRPFGVGLLFPSRADSLPPVAGPASTDAFPEFLKALGDPVSFDQPRPPAFDHETAEKRLDIAIAEGVGVLSFGLGAPKETVARAKAAGMTIIALVGSRRAALAVEANGADIIVAQGHEAGGHTGKTATMVLVPQIVDAVKVSVVAAGGISDGRIMAAALMLGASGVLVGTALQATPEARTAPAHKDKLVQMVDDETIVSRCYTGKPSRVIRNAFTDAWRGHESEIKPMPEQWHSVAPLVAPAKAKGLLEIANWPTGQGAVLLHAIKPAADVVREMAADAAEIIDGAADLFGGRA